MCIIIDGAPKDILSILKEHGARMWETNPDGAGIMFYNKTEFSNPLSLNKIKTLDGLLSGVTKLSERNVPRAAIHMRKASVGGVSEELTHPFKIGKGWMMHNGTVKDVAATGESDSQTLAKIITELPDDWYDCEGLVNLISCVVGESRILMFYNGLTFTFGKWTDHKGCSVSNTKFLEKPITPVASTYSGVQSHYRHKWYEDYGELNCTVCGKEIKTSREYQTGMCYKCEQERKDSERTCKECGAVSLYANTCSTCYAVLKPTSATYGR